MPPVDSTPNVIASSFQLVYSTKAFNKIPIFEYESTTTGLTVVIAEVDGPTVDGFFCIATEAFDDDGLPHTLEHLIFLGSEEYPYKGVLDLLANRCFAAGTNAWTDVDHTCYTMETAGNQGFLALMPIYLEHILYPTLTDEGFITEVHHITPSGEDAGVVYCEMQGRENSAESRLHLTVARLMYPGKCGYSSETGGIMKNLRESTSNKKIKKYHEEFYRPENLKIIITGRVDHETVFKSLSKLEEKILSKGSLGPFQRPWQTPVPLLEKSTDMEIKYPADDESNGLFCIAWRGASAVKDQYTVVATSLMLKYLSDFSVSPLQKQLVEIEDPYASEITYNLYHNSETCAYLTFEDVPVAKLDQIKSKLDTILKNIVDKEDIDMERMESIIKRHRLESLSFLEGDPHSTVAFLIIAHVLYGNTKEDLEQRVNPLMDLDSLRKEPKSYWVSLLRKYFVDNKYVAIRCKPSKEEKLKMAQEEKERVTEQINSLGPKGLEIKEKELEKAIEFNDREPGEEMLVSLPIPEISSIYYHNIVRLRTDANTNRSLDLSDAPVFTFFDDVNSNFVYIYALLDTKFIKPDLRNYLPLFFETLLELPLMKDGQLIPYEKVVAELYNDTVTNSAHLGSSKRGLFKCGSNSTTGVVMLQVECSNFQKGLTWLKDILYSTVFTVERLKVTAKKMLNSVAQAKRSGNDMVNYSMKALWFSEDSNILRSGVLNQNKFLSHLVDDLDGPKADEIISKLTEIKKSLSTYENFSLYLAGNLRSLPNPTQLIKETFGSRSVVPKRLKYTCDYELIRTEGRKMPGCIIGMACLESSYFIQSARAITNLEDPDVPALNLFLQYLTQAEGPIWKQVRGKGLAYSYSMHAKYHEGLIYLTFYRATNVVAAYKETLQIVKKQITSKEWDETLLDAAKNSHMFEIIAQEKTIGDVVSLSVSSYLHDVDYSYYRNLTNSIKKVTVADLNRVGEKYVAPLFDPSRVTTSVATDPSRIEEVSNGLKECGLNLKVYQSLEESFLNEIYPNN